MTIATIARIAAVVAVASLLAGCGLLVRIADAPPGAPPPSPLPLVCTDYRLVAADGQAATPELTEDVRAIVEERLRATGIQPVEVSALGPDGIQARVPVDADLARVQ